MGELLKSVGISEGFVGKGLREKGEIKARHMGSN